MSFFLLGKYPDDRLALLSEAAFSTRQQAMSELSRMTAMPEFDAWDAEVLVLDSELGTPVLLVRPSSVEVAPDPVSEDALPLTVETTDDTSPDAAEESDPALAAVILDLGAGDNGTSTPQATADDDDLEPVDDPVEPTPPNDNPIVQPDDEAAAEPDTFVAESAVPDEVVDTAWAEAVVESGETVEDGLKGALKRTAEQMESQGISAPDSVGAAGKPSEDRIEAPIEEPAGEPEGAADVEQPAEVESPEVDDPVATGWPWDEVVEPATRPESQTEAEMTVDDESMIRALADDTSSRTVVLGEYVVDDVPAQDSGNQDAAQDVEESEPVPAKQEESTDSQSDGEPSSPQSEIETVVGDAPSTDDGSAPEEAAGAPAEVHPEDSSAETESDFVDLGVVSETPPAKAYEPGEVDMDEMTCDDCVYVETCPNKDEREPRTCGSFQWK